MVTTKYQQQQSPIKLITLNLMMIQIVIVALCQNTTGVCHCLSIFHGFGDQLENPIRKMSFAHSELEKTIGERRQIGELGQSLLLYANVPCLSVSFSIPIITLIFICQVHAVDRFFIHIAIALCLSLDLNSNIWRPDKMSWNNEMEKKIESPERKTAKIQFARHTHTQKKKTQTKCNWMNRTFHQIKTPEIDIVQGEIISHMEVFPYNSIFHFQFILYMH